VQSATRLMSQPGRNTLTQRHGGACRGWDRGPSGCARGSRVRAGLVSSARPPRLSTPKVAPAPAHQTRAARGGSLRRGRGPCPPPRLVILPPCALPARKPSPPRRPPWAPERGALPTARHPPPPTGPPASRGGGGAAPKRPCPGPPPACPAAAPTPGRVERGPCALLDTSPPSCSVTAEARPSARGTDLTTAPTTPERPARSHSTAAARRPVSGLAGAALRRARPALRWQVRPSTPPESHNPATLR
jgi:hypothetical protein